MKNHKYPPELVERIICDPDYWFLFFRELTYSRRDHLFLPKRRNNGDLTMKCPLHTENTPSLRINAKDNCFKCFGCGSSGRFLEFLMKFHNSSFFEAIGMALSIKPNPAPVRGGYEWNRTLYLNSLQTKLVFKGDHPSYPPIPENDDLPF